MTSCLGKNLCAQAVLGTDGVEDGKGVRDVPSSMWWLDMFLRLRGSIMLLSLGVELAAAARAVATFVVVACVVVVVVVVTVAGGGLVEGDIVM